METGKTRQLQHMRQREDNSFMAYDGTERGKTMKEDALVAIIPTRFAKEKKKNLNSLQSTLHLKGIQL